MATDPPAMEDRWLCKRAHWPYVQVSIGENCSICGNEPYDPEYIEIVSVHITPPEDPPPEEPPETAPIPTPVVHELVVVPPEPIVAAPIPVIRPVIHPRRRSLTMAITNDELEEIVMDSTSFNELFAIYCGLNLPRPDPTTASGLRRAILVHLGTLNGADPADFDPTASTPTGGKPKGPKTPATPPPAGAKWSDKFTYWVQTGTWPS